MTQNCGDGSLPEEKRCKRFDGKKWRCSRPVAEGKGFCDIHLLQSRQRQQKVPIPDNLKLERTKRAKVIVKIEEEESTNLDVRSSDLPRKRGKRKRNDLIDVSKDKSVGRRKTRPVADIDRSSLPWKRTRRVVKKDNSVDISEQLDDSKGKVYLRMGSRQLDSIKATLLTEAEREQEKPIVKVLKYGTLEITPASPFSKQPKAVKRASSSIVKTRVPASRSVSERLFRSKNIQPLPMPTVQISPSLKAKQRASAKKKRCHWCRWTSYRVFVKCSTCKKQFFCEECINQRFHDKAAVKRECPVCLGTCCCRTCTKRSPKEVETKELVVQDCEKKFDKTQQLHMIRLLLPLMEQMNQEKIIELDIEANNIGITHGRLEVQFARYSQQQQCCFCKACVPDVHRSCRLCSYILCLHCCQEFRDGGLHRGLEDLKNTKMVRSKSLSNISWKLSADGDIECPPMNLGGCGDGFLDLTCFSQFSWTKDLEASAKQIVSKYESEKPFVVDSSSCPLCAGNDEMGSEKVGNLIKNKALYFSIQQDLRDNILEHFMNHWGKGQPLIIQDVLKSQPELCWDFGFMLCRYLERSAESWKDMETVKSKSRSDWCEVQFGRKQIFVGGKTHVNVWQEFLKFKVWLSSGFFQDQFPNHYAAVMQALPLQEYIHPFTGLLNLAANPPHETQNPNMGPSMYISYGGPEDLMNADLLTKLCYHPYDVVNILVHATEHPMSERKLNEVKILMHKYSSQDHIKSSRKIKTRNKLEELFGSLSGLEEDTNGELTCMPNGEVHLSSDDSSTGDSDGEDFTQYESGSSSCYGEEQVVDTCGSQWDIFRREDVPKLVEYLRKYSDKLSKSNSSPKKVVHPLFDEIFYLDDIHITRLKEEFDVEPWSFQQDIGEAVIIPAGCPYQIKKLKSCVNVVLEFISPESASECIKVGGELRQLPVNHKAKGKMPEVTKMVIKGMHAAIEDIRTVL